MATVIIAFLLFEQCIDTIAEPHPFLGELRQSTPAGAVKPNSARTGSAHRRLGQG